jgi:NitT/TauT family transport system substrate-binding protein
MVVSAQMARFLQPDRHVSLYRGRCGGEKISRHRGFDAGRPAPLVYRTVLAVVLLAGAWLLSACGREPKPATAGSGPEPARVAIRLQTDWYPQAEHGGFYQALAKGYYEEAGLDVTILAGGPGPQTPQKIIGGTADIGVHRSDDIMVHVAEGLPFVLVAAYMQHDPQAILLHAENPVNSFAQLDGKTIMAMPGTNWIRYLKQRFKIDFQLIPMNYGLAQFIADKNFIQQCFVTNEPYYVRQQGARPKTLLIAGSGYDPYRVIFTTRRFLRDHPEAVRAFVAASIRGWEDFMTSDPSPAKKLIARRNEQMTDDFMDYSIRSMHEHRLVQGDPAKGERLGLLRPQRLREQAAMLSELQIVKEPLSLEAFATFDFLPPEVQEAAKE